MRSSAFQCRQPFGPEWYRAPVVQVNNKSTGSPEPAQGAFPSRLFTAASLGGVFHLQRSSNRTETTCSLPALSAEGCTAVSSPPHPPVSSLSGDAAAATYVSAAGGELKRSVQRLEGHPTASLVSNADFAQAYSVARWKHNGPYDAR